MTSLLDQYRRYAADQGNHMIEGEADASNEAYDRLQGVFVALARGNKRGDLFMLYSDADPWVQCGAAGHTLEVDEAGALAKLSQLEKAGFPHVSTDAKYTIQEWKNGALRFLPS